MTTPGAPAEITCSYCQKACVSKEALGAHLLEDHAQLPPEAVPAAATTVPLSLDRLSAAEEVSLSQQVRAGGPGAKAATRLLVEFNQGLVHTIARKFTGAMELEDLVQEGNIGLLKAVERFDPDRGFRFGTYAVWWIRNAIQRSLSDKARAVRLPANLRALGFKARRLLDSGLPMEEVALATGASEEAITDAVNRVSVRSVSMDAVGRDDDESATLGASLASPELAGAAIDGEQLERLLGTLSGDHRMVLVRLYGLAGEEKASASDLSLEMGITRARLYQIEAQALEHLKTHCVTIDQGGVPQLSLDGEIRKLPPIRRKRGRETYDFDPALPNQEPPVTRKSPLPHQDQAVAAILKEFETNPRATAVMACGTGKTLVGMWVYQGVAARTALILAPSLALLRQTLREWRGHEAADRYLCVCSDDTVGEDAETRLEARDLGIPVTTDPDELRRCLEARGDERTVVLCTYQSARVLGKGLPLGFTFDLAIFDEAHRTAGARDRDFSYGLVNSQIACRRRLFMTATPKGTVTDGSESSPFSMADERAYGRIVYELGLSEAIQREIICDYKVVIAVVTEKEVADFFGRPAHVKTKGGELSAREAAYYIAFARAVQECGAGKIITFHGGVSSAQKFARSRWLSEDLLPEAFRTFHVNGKMPAGLRQAILSRFSQVEASVVTNARCLNEGVDVPAVDMVAFMSPRKSRTDILQTIGRALRKAPGKTVGYVMLPVLIDEAGNPLSTAAEYRDLSAVIYSLRSQDLTFDRKVRLHSFQKGLGKKAPLEGLEDRVLFTGPEILPETMRRAITARVLTPMGSSWDEMFGRLILFKKSHGTFLITKTTGELQLRNWMVAQRASRRDNRLSERQLTLLDSVGFPWDPKNSAWATMVAALGEWRARHGTCRVPFAERKLYGFVHYARYEKNVGRLRPERISELDAMGFDWGVTRKVESWESKFEIAKTIVAKLGWPSMHKAPPKIRHWLSNQRRSRRLGWMTAEHAALLEAIGMPWKLKERRVTVRRPLNTTKREVGAIVTRRGFDNGRDVEDRWIKVSDTGRSQDRWRPYARWVWEQNKGPIPEGKSVMHINGDRLDDRIENLMIGGAADRMRLAHQNDPEMSKRNRLSCRQGTSDFNRRMGKLNRMKSVIQKYWYPVLAAERVILNCPFRRRATLLAHFGADITGIPASGHGPSVERAIQQAGVEPVRGDSLKDSPYASFMRLDPELGIADPGKVDDAEGRRKRLESMPLWANALRAAALDLSDRK